MCKLLVILTKSKIFFVQNCGEVNKMVEKNAESPVQSIKLEYCVTIATLLLVTCYLLLGHHYHCPPLTAHHMAATQTPHS